ncbi:uncharacterized protein [Paramisgurnus dabryanus]|uniref:uncharacterized protein n=1 Tax=Paramisgurnus dabryanus TaxID=90735 RepID=UPI0031F3C85A
MRILFGSLQKGQDAMFLWEGNVSQKNGQTNCDCSSEDFNKPKLSYAFVNRMKVTICSKNKLQQKQSITLDSSKHIIIDLATQLDRITKVSGISLASILVDDLCLKDCTSFIFRWSEKLKCLKSTNKAKVYSTARFRCSEGMKFYTDQTLTEDHKDLLWWIHILQSIPKSSVCQEGSARVELLNLYSQWKKGQLKNMLPIMDFIMRALLKEKGSILKQMLQHRSSQKWRQMRIWISDCIPTD